MGGRHADDAVAIYTALIRHELGLPPGADALTALETRLAPGEPSLRPSPKAPAVRRLVRAAARLRRGLAPQASLDTLTDDLRFLRLFDDDAPGLDEPALSRLLDDVLAAPAAMQRGRRPRPARAGEPAPAVGGAVGQARAPALRRTRPSKRAKVTPFGTRTKRQ